MEKLFGKYLQSVCSPEESQEFIQWVEREGNDKLLTSMIKPHWDRIMNEESLHPINQNLWNKVSKAIEAEEKAPKDRRLNLYSWGLRIAAILIVALILSNLLLFRQNQLPDSLTHTQTVSVPNGSRSSLTLPDGSKVWLNAGSSLTFNLVFGKTRSVKLEGEAYFDIFKAEAPFIVSTSLGNVEVTGTEFNVKALTAENQFETTVEEGSVKVENNAKRVISVLKPGQQARLENGKWMVSNVETDLYTSWKEGKIIFRSEKLPGVAKRLERWYNVKIELADDPRLQKIHYTGTLEMESFSEVLELLKVTAAVNYTYNDKTRVIYITHR
jgi:ferric-dicitrate binding protein FerR (iron transport regulator)